MRPSLALKTLFRTMGKTVFTFLLIAVLTFSLFLQLAEYVKTAAEFKANVEMYSGTGYVEYRPAIYKGVNIRYPYYLETDPRVNAVDIPGLEAYKYPSLSAETVEEIGQLPCISSVQKRYMTAGVSPDYMRMKEDMTRYDYNGRLILEGTIDQTFVPLQMRRSLNNAHTLRNVKVLAGDTRLEELLQVDGTVYFEANQVHPGDKINPVNFMAEDWVPTATDADYNTSNMSGDPWLVKHVTLKNYDYGDRFQAQFKEGDRYVFVFRFERQAANRYVGYIQKNYTALSLELYDWASEHVWPSAWNITDAPENYLELPEYAPLKELIEITETDLNTFDVVYTDDMSAIQRIHDSTLYIAEGRWLTPEDTAKDAKVCVVDRTLAKKYNLKLGDRLSLDLGHTLFEQFYSLGAVASVPERFSEDWTADEFEIVGFYIGSTFNQDANEPNWAYSMNTVFVPLSSLPLTEAELAGHEFAPGEITLRVDSAWDIEGFLKKAAPRIEAMGLMLTFDDGGWMEVLEGYRAAQKLPLIRIILLAFVTVVGLALNVYLFVSRKKKDYAIMRALGTPKGRAAWTLLAPLMVLTVAAVLLGLAAGAGYSRARLGTLSALPLAICAGGELILTLLFAGLSIRKLSKQPPLLLLQDSKAKKAKKTGTKTAFTAVSVPVAPAPAKRSPAADRAVAAPVKSGKEAASGRFVLRYVWRHIRRQGFKSTLAVLLAAFMVGAVVQFASLRATYSELRESTVVTVQFTRSLSLTRLQPLLEEGFAKDVYYERNATIAYLPETGPSGGEDTVQLVITPDLDRYLNQDYEISLGEGYTREDIGKMDRVLVGEDLMAEQGLQPGDTVRFGMRAYLQSAYYSFVGDYWQKEYFSKGLEPETIPTTEELRAYYGEEMDRGLDQAGAKAEVIGTITTESGTYRNAVFTAGFDNDDVTFFFGTYQTMPLIEFTLTDNSRAEELRQRCEEITNGRKGAYVLDTEALESVVRTSELLNDLYLPVIALALLIGAALCVLLVLQTGRDAAIMRAQGTTKRKTRAMLAVEQIILGVIGVVVGLVLMLVWKRGGFAAIALQAGLFAAAYALVLVLVSFASATLAIKKNILELLQTKE